MDNDLLVNDGSFFQIEEPTEQLREKQEERAKVKSALPLIQDILTRLENDIKQLDSLQYTRLEAAKRKVSIELMGEANDLARERLVSQKEYLEGLRDTYK